METITPIIQSFFGTVVRFFNAEFKMEMRHHYDTPSPTEIVIKTWAVALPDYATSIGYPEHLIRRMIRLNNEVFRHLWRIEQIPDVLGRIQPTILMAQAMCDMLATNLYTSRIKDPSKRAAIIRFQQWTMIVFDMIRMGKLRPARWPQRTNVSQKYLPLLSIPSGKFHREKIIELAREEGRCLNTIYRRLKLVRGSNIITAKGKPRKSRKTCLHLPIKTRWDRSDSSGKEEALIWG